jgi:hypothetical protein
MVRGALAGSMNRILIWTTSDAARVWVRTAFDGDGEQSPGCKHPSEKRCTEVDLDSNDFEGPLR